MKPAKRSGSISSSSTFFALRQNGSLTVVEQPLHHVPAAAEVDAGTSGCCSNTVRISFGSPGSIVSTSWNSSKIKATRRRPSSAASSAGSSSSRSSVASRSVGEWSMPKEKW